MGRKPGSKNVKKEVCNAVYDAVASESPVTSVAAYREMPQSTVSNIVTRIELRRSGVLKKKMERPKTLVGESLQALEDFILNNQWFSIGRISEKFEWEGRSFSKSTIQRYMKVLNIRSYSALQKPYLRGANIDKRLAWAATHENWSDADWDRVMFTD